MADGSNSKSRWTRRWASRLLFPAVLVIGILGWKLYQEDAAKAKVRQEAIDVLVHHWAEHLTAEDRTYLENAILASHDRAFAAAARERIRRRGPAFDERAYYDELLSGMINQATEEQRADIAAALTLVRPRILSRYDRPTTTEEK